MIKSIAHFADIHIYSNERHDEYREQFNKVYSILENRRPERVIIVGDLLQTFITSNEGKIVASEFLNRLTDYTEYVIIVPGNHDIFLKNLTKINTVETLVKIIANPKIKYFGESGFFEDENIVWVNHSHLQKNINPWFHIDHVKDNSKCYIDIFHDPIYGCTTDLGQVFDGEHYRKVSDFKGDLVMMGDIHKLSYFRDDKTMAYSSSLIQQNFGENVENHGFLYWDIETKKSEFIEVPNERKFINLNIDRDVDYDDLESYGSLDTKHTGDLKIKIHWRDYRQNINVLNQGKITKFIKERYNPISITFDKTIIEYGIVDSDVKEDFDINNQESVRNIFVEYLKDNNFSEKIIEEVFSIDNIIDSRIGKVETSNVTWNIESLWFDNFKSYGDSNLVEWSNKSGLFEISGQNQVGKTTILDAICYCYYGTTMATNNKQKFGDNRFINNKRDQDSCKVGSIININNQKTAIIRETTRVKNKKGVITSTPTTVKFYNVVDEQIDFDNELTNEEYTKTNNLITSVIGSFDDFIRMVLTTADNLNSLLSVNRADFIDSILRDAGWDIFERKLNEFKIWKKEHDLDNPRIKLDLKLSKDNISNYQEEISNKNNDILNEENNKLEFIEKDKELNSQRDDLNKSIIKIDNPVDIDEVNSEISKLNSDINLKKNKIDLFDSEKSTMIVEFDEDKYTSIKENLDVIKDNINNENNSKNILNSDITKIDFDLERLETLRDKVKNDRINELNVEISDIKLKLNDYNNNITSFRKESITKCKNYVQARENEITQIKIKIKSNEDLIEMLNKDNDNLDKSKVCVTCNRTLAEQDIVVIKEKIVSNNDKISEYVKINSEFIENIKELKLKIDTANEKEQMILKDDWQSLFKENEILLENNNKINEFLNNIEKINSLISNISEDSVVEDKMTKIEDKKNEFIKNKKDIESKILIINSKVESLIIERDNLNIQYSLLSSNRVKYLEYVELSKEVDRLPLEIENLRLKLKTQEDLKSKYDKDLSIYNKNLEINKEISNIDILISDNKKNLDRIDNVILDLRNLITSYEVKIEGIEKDIKHFEQRESIEVIHNAYRDLLSRDGVPMILLKRSMGLINTELSNLMNELDFIVYFDDDINLLMSMKSRLDVSQNVIESSGKERTFSAVALKIALAQINKKSRPNFILLDEIMGKLADKSVDEFISLLDVIKTKVDKIVIVEHNHNLNYDYRINVFKENDISYLELI